jgi:hypothetical protein
MIDGPWCQMGGSGLHSFALCGSEAEAAISF